jgi:thioredoxin reductase (NADPH)
VAAPGRCPLTALRRYRDGARLFEAGDREFRFHVIKSGEVATVDTTGAEPRTIAVVGPGDFAGDETKLTGEPCDRRRRGPRRLRGL